MGLHNRKSVEPWIRDEIDFYQHQADAVRILWNRPSFLLADDMGLGKTLTVLTLFGIHCKMRWSKRQRRSKMLVICSPSLKGNWAEEIEQFTRFKYVVLAGKTKDERDLEIGLFHMINDDKILIINYEQVKSHLAQINAMGFDIVAADECHLVKTPNADRTRAFRTIKAERFFMMTGTPLENNAHELWVSLDRIQPGKWGTYDGYCQKFVRYGGFRNKAITGYKNEHILKAGLSNVMLRRLKKDTLDLPEVQIIPRYCELTSLQRQLYESAERDLSIEVAEDVELDLDNPAVKFMRLKQICGTTATLLESGEDSSGKLDLACQDALELIANGNKIVVFTNFLNVLDSYCSRMRKLLPELPIYQLHGGVQPAKRVPMVNEWAAIDGPAIMACMIQVGGVGLNMTAANKVQFLDKAYTPSKNNQAIDRVNRIGASKTQPIQVFEYRARGTVETRVEQIIREKKETFQNVVEDARFYQDVKRVLVNEVRARRRAA